MRCPLHHASGMNYDIDLTTLEGEPASLSDYRDRALLIVNVASKCGFTPQYAGLEALHERYQSRGLSVLGFPCNQFGAQEPGSAREIREFCSSLYGVSFPMFEKIDVNGPGRHPLYAELVGVFDSTGTGGDVAWNFEKFLVAPGGKIQRFRSSVDPESPELVRSIEAFLPR